MTYRRRAPIDHPTELRIARVLQDKRGEGISYVALARAISAASNLGPDDRDAIDRRKLKKIVEGDSNVALSIAELHALDRYLEPLGEGLAYNPFFLRANILQTIADAGRPVTFLLGSKPMEDRLTLDHWDVIALTEVQRGVNNFGRDVRFDIHDVELHDTLADAKASISPAKWSALLADDGPSLVCLGSSRATHATELLLARMFKVPPFEDSPERKAALPFHFVWPPDLDHVFPSAFHYTAEDIAAGHPKDARKIQSKTSSALELVGDVHLDRIKQRHGRESLGVCVAQRRRGGQVWLVLAGVTGPATHAAACLTASLAWGLHPTGPGEPSEVHLTAVRVPVQRERGGSAGRLRTAKGAEAFPRTLLFRPPLS